MRLAKHLAHAGIASRRAADAMIVEGRVRLDGLIVTDPARDVDSHNRVEVDGLRVGSAESRIVYALNKPVGVVSTARDTHGRPTVVEVLGESRRRVYPVGRLDADSSGLILLTNDGELANLLTHPRFEVPKTYRVRLGRGPLSSKALTALRTGVMLEDGVTGPAKVRRVDRDTIEITIAEGRKRQVRRMCAAVGHPVSVLERIRFGSLTLGRLRAGEHRCLSGPEVERLRAYGRRR